MTVEAVVFGVMTSGASTAALLSLLPAIESLIGRPVMLLSRSVGVGDSYIPNRLKRGEVADIVIVADDLLRQCMADGLVLAGSRMPLVQSLSGMAVRAATQTRAAAHLAVVGQESEHATSASPQTRKHARPRYTAGTRCRVPRGVVPGQAEGRQHAAAGGHTEG